MLLRRRITVADRWKGPIAKHLKMKKKCNLKRLKKMSICITYVATSVPVRNLVKTPGFGSWVKTSPMNLKPV